MPNAKSADGQYDTSGDWGVIEGPVHIIGVVLGLV